MIALRINLMNISAVTIFLARVVVSLLTCVYSVYMFLVLSGYLPRLGAPRMVCPCRLSWRPKWHEAAECLRLVDMVQVLSHLFSLFALAITGNEGIRPTSHYYLMLFIIPFTRTKIKKHSLRRYNHALYHNLCVVTIMRCVVTIMRCITTFVLLQSCVVSQPLCCYNHVLYHDLCVVTIVRCITTFVLLQSCVVSRPLCRYNRALYHDLCVVTIVRCITIFVLLQSCVVSRSLCCYNHALYHDLCVVTIMRCITTFVSLQSCVLSYCNPGNFRKRLIFVLFVNSWNLWKLIAY